MEENLKKLLKDLKEKEDTRQNTINEINMEIERIGWRQESEEERFAGKRKKDENGEIKWLKQGGIYDDIKAGIYNNKTEGQMQKIIDEELEKIKQKYDAEKLDVNKKLEETQKQNEEEKVKDYKIINAAIKDYHLDMVLETNKANKELIAIEAERNEKLAEMDKAIKEKEAARTHLIMQNRNFMNIEVSEAIGDINALGQEIERLKEEREGLNNEYSEKLKIQSDKVQYCNEQKESAAKFLGSIKLSEKSIDEIQQILFGKEELAQGNSELEERTESESETKTTPETSPAPEAKTLSGTKTVSETKTTPRTNPASEAKKVPGTKTESKAKNEENKPQEKDKIKRFKIHINKWGSALEIFRNENDLLDAENYTMPEERTENKDAIDFENENKEMLQSLRNRGDEAVIYEIVNSVGFGSISKEEGRKQLNNYLNTLIGKDTKDTGFSIEYDLRGIARSGMSPEDRKYIIQKAKEARKFQESANVTVKPGFFRGMLWKAEDAIEKMKIWDKNKALPEGSSERKMSEEEIKTKKDLLKARLKDTGRVTDTQLGQGLNAALKQQDEIKKEIDNDAR